MKRLDLIQYLPAPPPGKPRGLLTKQKQFLDAALKMDGHKYLLYCGGVGSGKSVIGALTMILLAVMYPGDYLICRLFNPELKITSIKTFLDICPPELVAEHRVADQVIRIKTANGKISNVIYRGLDEPDKHRSLNLNAAWIDESSQVSEEAFYLLQSRLRGAHVRKIFLTTNPAGHDWQYRLFALQDGFSEAAKKQFLVIKAPSTENQFLPDGYVQAMKDTYSKERYEREVLGSWDAFEGQVYSEFRRDTHVVQPFRIPDEWNRFIGADHGYTNPAAFLWCAVDYDGNLYVYREYYETQKLVKEIARDVTKLSGREKIDYISIDPSIRAVRSQTGASDWDAYQEHLPANFSLTPAKNEVAAGIDRVKTHLKVNEVTGRPKLYIFENCKNLIEEITQYRYDDNVAQNKNAKETPRKYNDHAVDALRYAIMSRPELPRMEDIAAKRRQAPTLEGALQRELQSVKKPKPKDFLNDF